MHATVKLTISQGFSYHFLVEFECDTVISELFYSYLLFPAFNFVFYDTEFGRNRVRRSARYRLINMRKTFGWKCFLVK
jgi:hypothetical protein